MNYIRHLNAVFQKFYTDSKLNVTHISLYMALFQYWNINRFPEKFYINREDIMKMSKIGSKATYHRCLTNLDRWKYIKYYPSHNPYKGSTIRLLIFDTSYEPTSGTISDTTTDITSKQLVEQALVSTININKQIENDNKRELPKNKNEVLFYFEEKKWPRLEGEKFYNHYNSINWNLGGKIKITNWQSTAENWMLKAIEFERLKEPSQKWDNLRTSKLKDYGQPL